MSEPSSTRRKSASSRVLMWVILSIGFLIFGSVFHVFFQVYKDREAKGLTRQGLSVGVAVSDRMLAFRLERGKWPEDTGNYTADGKRIAPAHIRDITVIKDGVVRIAFNAPDQLRGGWIEIETFQKEGRFFRACRGIGIIDQLLPSGCHGFDQPEPVEPPK